MDAVGLEVLLKEIEADCQRICHEFENHFDKRGDYHERLIQRLALALPGIRPAFIPKAGVRCVREPEGFRHVGRHAYDLEFREQRLIERTSLAGRLAAELPS